MNRVKQPYNENSANVFDIRNERNTSGRRIRKKTLANVGKRERVKVAEELKASLPILESYEVRRYYAPYHEAILLELQEEGHPKSASYIDTLLKFDEEVREKAGPGTLIWEKPYLKHQKKFINFLRDRLTKYEEASKIGDHDTEVDALLDIAIFFQRKTWEWWWIAEYAYQTAHTITKSITADQNYTIALTKYLYGKFLFSQLQIAKQAIVHLDEAREAAESKNWTASRKLGQKEESMFKECNTVLYKALLHLAQEIKLHDPGAALEACKTALVRAMDTTEDEYIVQTLLDLGKAYIGVGDIKNALRYFARLLAMAKRTSDSKSVCDAHRELAFAYKALNDATNTEKHLSLYRECARNFDLTDKLAEAHYYTGEHYLSEGKPSIATQHLEIALNLYDGLGLRDDADRARTIAGVSQGQERLEDYFDLIVRCGKSEQRAIVKLCEWKNKRADFRKESCDSTSQLEYLSSSSNESDLNT